MIEVLPYDARWPAAFAALEAEYAAALASVGVPVVAIEHVGSTSVPGLAAKPVLDVDIVVAEADVAAASDALAGLGFTPLGDLGIAQRHAFRAPERLAPTHTYVVVDGSLALRNHLAVRDVLRADPVLRDEYAAVKLRAGRDTDDIDDYVRRKSEVVQRILATAGLSEADRSAIDAAQP